MATTQSPAAKAEAMPAVESSKTKPDDGGMSSFERAWRYPSGSGLLRG